MLVDGLLVSDGPDRTVEFGRLVNGRPVYVARLYRGDGGEWTLLRYSLTDRRRETPRGTDRLTAVGVAWSRITAER